jgi:hypothetical protein
MLYDLWSWTASLSIVRTIQLMMLIDAGEWRAGRSGCLNQEKQFWIPSGYYVWHIQNCVKLQFRLFHVKNEISRPEHDKFLVTSVNIRPPRKDIVMLKSQSTSIQAGPCGLHQLLEFISQFLSFFLGTFLTSFFPFYLSFSFISLLLCFYISSFTRLSYPSLILTSFQSFLFLM